jgi:hypothetical protein
MTGSVTVPALGDPKAFNKLPVGAFGLAAAAVSSRFLPP